MKLDEASLLLETSADITLGALEKELSATQVRLPIPSTTPRHRTIAELLSSPSPADTTPRWGAFVSSCAGIVATLFDGHTEVRTRIAPRKATGPDWIYAFVGTENALGTIASATIRVFRRGEHSELATRRCASNLDALSAARSLLQLGARPTEIVVHAGGLLSVHFEGRAPIVKAELALLERLAPIPAERSTAIAVETAQAISMADLSRWPKAAQQIVGWHLGGAAVVSSFAAKPRAAFSLTFLEDWKKAIKSEVF